MSTISAALQNVDLDGGVEAARFPAATKQAVGLVNGAQTDVTSVYFADKILITISQGGRLSQWVIAFWIFVHEANSTMYRFKCLYPRLRQPLSTRRYLPTVRTCYPLAI
jgi:hypothetical protein